MAWYIWAAIAVAVTVLFFFIGVIYRKKVAEREISSAEDEARRIINEAIKGGENKKREMLVEAKEEIHKTVPNTNAKSGSAAQTCRSRSAACSRRRSPSTKDGRL